MPTRRGSTPSCSSPAAGSIPPRTRRELRAARGARGRVKSVEKRPERRWRRKSHRHARSTTTARPSASRAPRARRSRRLRRSLVGPRSVGRAARRAHRRGGADRRRASATLRAISDRTHVGTRGGRRSSSATSTSCCRRRVLGASRFRGCAAPPPPAPSGDRSRRPAIGSSPPLRRTVVVRDRASAINVRPRLHGGRASSPPASALSPGENDTSSSATIPASRAATRRACRGSSP